MRWSFARWPSRIESCELVLRLLGHLPVRLGASRTASSPPSMRCASDTSSAAVSSGTRPISRRYRRIESAVSASSCLRTDFLTLPASSSSASSGASSAASSRSSGSSIASSAARRSCSSSLSDGRMRSRRSPVPSAWLMSTPSRAIACASPVPAVPRTTHRTPLRHGRGPVLGASTSAPLYDAHTSQPSPGRACRGRRSPPARCPTDSSLSTRRNSSSCTRDVMRATSTSPFSVSSVEISRNSDRCNGSVKSSSFGAMTSSDSSDGNARIAAQRLALDAMRSGQRDGSLDRRSRRSAPFRRVLDRATRAPC